MQTKIIKQCEGQDTHHWLQCWELYRDIHGGHSLALKIVQHIATFMLRPVQKQQRNSKKTNKHNQLREASGYSNDNIGAAGDSPWACNLHLSWQPLVVESNQQYQVSPHSLVNSTGHLYRE